MAKLPGLVEWLKLAETVNEFVRPSRQNSFASVKFLCHLRMELKTFKQKSYLITLVLLSILVNLTLCEAKNTKNKSTTVSAAKKSSPKVKSKYDGKLVIEAPSCFYWFVLVSDKDWNVDYDYEKDAGKKNDKFAYRSFKVKDGNDEDHVWHIK